MSLALFVLRSPFTRLIGANLFSQSVSPSKRTMATSRTALAFRSDLLMQHAKGSGESKLYFFVLRLV